MQCIGTSCFEDISTLCNAVQRVSQQYLLRRGCGLLRDVYSGYLLLRDHLLLCQMDGISAEMTIMAVQGVRNLLLWRQIPL